MAVISFIATVLVLSQVLFFIGPFYLFGELAMAGRRRADR